MLVYVLANMFEISWSLSHVKWWKGFRYHVYIIYIYSIVCSALFLWRAVYTVHCTNIMHLRKPSFVITRHLINIVNRYFKIRGNKKRPILLKQFHLSTLNINIVKYQWFSPCAWRNSVMFRSHSRALAVRFFVLLFWRYEVDWECDVIADVDNGCGECVIPIRNEIDACNVRFDLTS